MGMWLQAHVCIRRLASENGSRKELLSTFQVIDTIDSVSFKMLKIFLYYIILHSKQSVMICMAKKPPYPPLRGGIVVLARVCAHCTPK